MGFLSNLFKKKQSEQQMVADNRDMYGFINIEREDGTVLRIKELLDRNGNQQCQTVVDQKTGEQLSIPQYAIMMINEQGEFKNEKVLMELSADALQNPQYTNWIANDMLSEQNMRKVLNEQHGYVGGVQTRDGEIVRTVYRPGVIDTLAQQYETEKNSRLLENIRGMEEGRYQIYRDAQAHEVNIKTSHAERLTPKNNPYRNNNRDDGYDR